MLPSNDWVEDCERFHGRILTGKKAHWCPDWDYLPIDETTVEFPSCTCLGKDDEEPKMPDTITALYGDEPVYIGRIEVSQHPQGRPIMRLDLNVGKAGSWLARNVARYAHGRHANALYAAYFENRRLRPDEIAMLSTTTEDAEGDVGP